MVTHLDRNEVLPFWEPVHASDLQGPQVLEYEMHPSKQKK